MGHSLARFHMISNMKLYTLDHLCAESQIFVGELNKPQGSSSDISKNSPLGGSLTKDYKIYTMIFILIFTFYFFKDSYSHMIFLQVVIQLTT
jgi:hypothetical protein